MAYSSSEVDNGEYEEEAADVGGPKKEFILQHCYRSNTCLYKPTVIQG